MSKVIVISTSLRPGSNSHMLAEQFAKGAQDAGHEVELISLRGKKIHFCIGCLSCQKTGTCVFQDDVLPIMESVLNADIVCWATPIYYYEMSGQMKTLIDRMNAMYPKDYRFRDVYLLTTAADDDKRAPRRAESGLQGWIDCFDKASLKGHVFCGGVDGAKEILGNAKLIEAYKMGLRVSGEPIVGSKAMPVRFLPNDSVDYRLQKMVLALGRQVLPRRQLVGEVGLKQNSRAVFINNYLKPAMQAGMVVRAYPNSISKPEQAYRLTANGLELYAQLVGEDSIL